jgi:hypothetical protein
MKWTYSSGNRQASVMLWVMKEVDHADNLLKEMTIKYPKK